MKEECRRFIEDPELEQEHALLCDECAALLEQPDGLDEKLAELRVETRASMAESLGDMPVAPWEGARHRSWGLVIAGAIAIIGLAAAAFSLIGVSPATGISDAVRGSLNSQVGWVRLFRVAPQLLREAPMQFHVFLFISFLSVNFLLYLLLRREPRGTDAPNR